MTGKSTTSLSFLPDDQQRHGMETETVALLPVLRRLEVKMVVAKGFFEGSFVAKGFFESSFFAKRFLEDSVVAKGFVHSWLLGGCRGKWGCPVLGWPSSATGTLVSHSGFQLKSSFTLLTLVLIHQVAPSLLGDEGEGAAVPLSEKIGKK